MEQQRILALGFFDGVHLGHGALLSACRDLARKRGCQAGAVTFASHPDALILGNAPALINTAADREWIMRQQYHMDTVITLPFDRAMMNMLWQDFFRLLRESYHAVGLVCGHDFRFGSRGAGNAPLLQRACAEAGMECIVVPEQKIDDITVSSTHIRGLLEEGQMQQAARFLGHPHFLTGQVVSGRHLGHKLGFPTANLLLPEDVVCPKHGVYACRVCFEGQEYLAVANVGHRPTVHGHRLTVEPWILDFAGDLYDREITLSFYAFLRPEKEFPDLLSLRAAVMEDARHTRDYFKNR